MQPISLRFQLGNPRAHLLTALAHCARQRSFALPKFLQMVIDRIETAADSSANLRKAAGRVHAFAHGLDFAGELNVERLTTGPRLALTAILIGDELTDLIELAHHVVEQRLHFLAGAFDALDVQVDQLSQ